MRRVLAALSLALSLALAVTLGAVVAAPAQADDNPVTPGDFTGYGFDQCLAPTQSAMDTWLRTSPFLAVGIYISGDSRACRDQPNLTPTWIRTQLRKGWRLMPITLGPQASCSDRFPRYGNDPTINPKPGRNGKYGKARKMGRLEAVDAVGAATKLGIAEGSTLWYDLEAFDITNKHCRESALAFLSAWTTKVKALDFVSGVYSSAGSGIKMLDDVRVSRPSAYVLPDMIWVARWDNQANTSTSYIREDGWRPGGRVKQYQGGHNETWGGVTINIDRNWLEVGDGSVAAPETHCGGVRVDFATYPGIRPATADVKPSAAHVKAMQCLLKERERYAGRINGRYNAKTAAAVSAWQNQRGYRSTGVVGPRVWVSLTAAGPRPILKTGSTGPAVRRVQRALNAGNQNRRLAISGVFDARLTKAVRRYQKSHGLRRSGIVDKMTWRTLARGLG